MAAHTGNLNAQAATAPGAGGTTGTGGVPAAANAAVAVAAVVRGLRRTFDGQRNIIDDLGLELKEGEFVALLGASGCGKSTLLRILAGLDREISGEVLIPAERAVAFQQPRLFPWKRVWKNVIAGLRVDDGKRIAHQALAEVGLTHRADAWPKVLSGGEAQRVSLARALVREPRLLLLDEPFSALDALTRLTVQRLVLDLWERHRPAVLLVTHDVEEAVLLADRILVMKSGRIEHDLRVDRPRPRDISDPVLAALRVKLLGLLGVGGDGTVEAPPAQKAQEQNAQERSGHAGSPR